MPSCVLLYACPICGVSSCAEVCGLTPPSTLVSQRSIDLLRRSQALQEQLGAPKQRDPMDSLSAEILENEARRRLVYATCPACGARNPEGLAAQSGDRRLYRVISVGVLVGLTLAAWIWPWVALLFLVMCALLPLSYAGYAIRRGEAVPYGKLALNLGIWTALGTLAALEPRVAFAIPLVTQLPAIVRPRPADDTRWVETAADIRWGVD